MCEVLNIHIYVIYRHVSNLDYYPRLAENRLSDLIIETFDFRAVRGYHEMRSKENGI